MEDFGNYRDEMDKSAKIRKKRAEEAKREREETSQGLRTPTGLTPRGERLKSRNLALQDSIRTPKPRPSPQSSRRSRGRTRQRGTGRAKTFAPATNQVPNHGNAGSDTDGSVEPVVHSSNASTPRRRFQENRPKFSIVKPMANDTLEPSDNVSVEHSTFTSEQQVPAGVASGRSLQVSSTMQQPNEPFGKLTQVQLPHKAKPESTYPSLPAGQFELRANSQRASSRAPSQSNLNSLSESAALSPKPPPVSSAAIGTLSHRYSREKLSFQRKLNATLSKESTQRTCYPSQKSDEEIVIDGGDAHEDELRHGHHTIPVSQSQPPLKPRRYPTMEARLNSHKRDLDDEVRFDQGDVPVADRIPRSKRTRPVNHSAGKSSTHHRRGSLSNAAVHEGACKAIPRDAFAENGVINLVDDEVDSPRNEAEVAVEQVESGLGHDSSHHSSDGKGDATQSLAIALKRSRQVPSKNQLENETVGAGAPSAIVSRAPVQHATVVMPPLRSKPVALSKAEPMQLTRRNETTCDESIMVPIERPRRGNAHYERVDSISPRQSLRPTSRGKSDESSPGKRERRLSSSMSVDLSQLEESDDDRRPGDLLEADISETMEYLKDLNVTEFGIVVLHYNGITDEVLESLCPEFEKISPLVQLDLSNNKIQVIVESLHETLEKVCTVHLAHNSISVIPNWFFLECTNLLRIDLAGNDLRAIPEGIAKARQLEYLDLSENKIEFLPSGIGLLPKLEILDVKLNMLKELPGDFGKENRSMIVLDISYNDHFCASFPKHCANFVGSIQDLFLTGTPLYGRLSKSQKKLSAPELIEVLVELPEEDISDNSVDMA